MILGSRLIVWVNYNNSLTWIKAIWDDFPEINHDSRARSQWGRYNLPRIVHKFSNLWSDRDRSCWHVGERLGNWQHSTIDVKWQCWRSQASFPAQNPSWARPMGNQKKNGNKMGQSSSIICRYPLVICYIAIENGPLKSWIYPATIHGGSFQFANRHRGHRWRSDIAILSGWWFFATPLKNDGLRQLGWWFFPIYGKIQNVPNHQPVLDVWSNNQSFDSESLPASQQLS